LTPKSLGEKAWVWSHSKGELWYSVVITADSVTGVSHSHFTPRRMSLPRAAVASVLLDHYTYTAGTFLAAVALVGGLVYLMTRPEFH
jgi:hypothetical protein